MAGQKRDQRGGGNKTAQLKNLLLLLPHSGPGAGLGALGLGKPLPHLSLSFLGLHVFTPFAEALFPMFLFSINDFVLQPSPEFRGLVGVRSIPGVSEESITQAMPHAGKVSCPRGRGSQEAALLPHLRFLSHRDVRPVHPSEPGQQKEPGFWFEA